VSVKLLALDVDGTLVGTDSVAAADVVNAIAAADAAGIRIVLATGRSYVETHPIWAQLRLTEPYEPLVLVGGALVTEPDTGRTLYHKPIARELAVAFSDALAEEGYPAMANLDGWRSDEEYVLAEHGKPATALRKWFSKIDVTIRRVQRMGEAADMPDPLRVSAVVPPDQAPAVAERLIERFDGRLLIHPILAPNYAVTIVEAHAAGADKWPAVRYVAQAYRIGAGAICAVGDDVNDLEMIRAAGLGVAMPDAPRSILSAADTVAKNGLAAFIRDLVQDRF